jgi:hypothetical protein
MAKNIAKLENNLRIRILQMSLKKANFASVTKPMPKAENPHNYYKN